MIYDYVIQEEASFRKSINVSEGWDWSFWEHIKRSTLYKNSQFERDNENRDKRPFRNIIRPILNIQYRTEGFDVKDIEIYADNSEIYYKSFIIRKYHDDWALENAVDNFIDNLVESYIDYGGVLVKDTDPMPEVVNLRTIAFCDQTDILSGPFAIKHQFSPQQLRDMEKNGWGNPKKGATIDIETLITLADKEKKNDFQKNLTPGKYIEIYELHGWFPDKEGKEFNQEIHIIAFYKNQNDQKMGVTLFAAKEPKLPFKFLSRDKIQGRALGFGGIEELFESQVWTNYSEIQIREMLELASKVFFKTTDQRFKTRNQLVNADNGQIFDLQQGTDISQIDTIPRNLIIFENAIRKWEEHANRIGAAGEVLQGEPPTAGTPFKSLETQIIEAKSLHKWRQGKIASFVEEIYRDWIIPRISKEITKGKKFLSELSSEEIIELADKIVDRKVFEIQKEDVLNGELPQDSKLLEQKIRTKFLKGGNKRFFELLKNELKDTPLKIKTNIAGRQKNLALLTDKVVNVLRQFLATPQIRQDPEMIKLLNVILESSGMSPIIFGAAPAMAAQQPSSATLPLKEFSDKTFTK